MLFFNFYEDLKNTAVANVTIVVFSEFGRRVRDNEKNVLNVCSSLVETTKEKIIETLILLI
jgi:hypothetical protein